MRSLILFAALSTAALACGGHGTRESLLVSTGWLADHLRDPHVVVIAVGDQSAYDQAHIPGARYLNGSAIQNRTSKLTLELAPIPVLADAFGKLGVGDDSRVVLYFISDQFASRTTRVFLTLDAMGLGDRTSLLDGGFSVWQKENRPVTAEVPSVAPAKLTPCVQSDVVVDADYVHSNLNHPGVDIVDARDPQFYTGASHSNGKRPGHIPGAANLTFSTLFDDSGKFKTREVLATMFKDAGVKAGDRVVSYCHIGQQATVVYFAARYLGYDARLYDGSWEDWTDHADFPATLGDKR